MTIFRETTHAMPGNPKIGVFGALRSECVLRQCSESIMATPFLGYNFIFMLFNVVDDFLHPRCAGWNKIRMNWYVKIKKYNISV